MIDNRDKKLAEDVKHQLEDFLIQEYIFGGRVDLENVVEKIIRERVGEDECEF